MLKTLGLISVCLAIGSFGFLKYEQLSFRKRYLSELVMFADSCTNLMRVDNRNVFAILNEYRFDVLAFFRYITPQNISDIEVLKTLFMQNRINECDIKHMCDFVTRLGIGDIESQENHCKSYSEVFRHALNQAEQDVNVKGKLHRTLSLLAAVAVFIIFI